MKLILSILLLLITLSSSAQLINIQGTNNKTTSLIFPSSILHVDIGMQNDYIGVNVDQSVSNLLKLRMSSNFKEVTNMLVVTQENYVYSFEISYSDSLANYVHIIKPENAINNQQSEDKTNNSIGDTIKEKSEYTIYKEIINLIENYEGNTIRSELAKEGKMTLIMKNIFVKSDDLYIQLEVNNNSNLKYVIDFYNLFMKSDLKKGLTTTTSQDIQIPFDFCNEKTTEIIAGEKKSIIMHFKKLTLEEDKVACLEIYEKQGGRHLKIKFGNNEILSAAKL